MFGRSRSPSFSSRGGGGAGFGVGGSANDWVSFAFVFNLLVGAGALAIPRPFAQAGFLLAGPSMCFMAFMSFVTAMYTCEVLIIKAMLEDLGKKGGGGGGGGGGGSGGSLNEVTDGTTQELYLPPVDTDSAPLLGRRRNSDGGDEGNMPTSEEATESSKKLEMGALSKALFTPLGSKLTYVILSLYLFGDMAIYTVAIPKSLTALVCPHKQMMLRNFGDIEDWECHNLRGFHSTTVYRWFLLLFGAVQLPFMFQTVQKTLFIQVLSITYRWLAFFIIIVICLVQMFSEDTKEERVSWDDFVHQHNVRGLLPMFGVTIYSFMCHHSLPSLLNPLMSSMPAEQLQLKRIARPVAWALVCCLFVYLLMNSIVAMRFKPNAIEDVITLNFQNFKAHEISVFLELFPVCTLGTSFPIIACTLRNNLQTLISMQKKSPESKSRWLKFVEKVAMPLIVLFVPILIAFFTQDVEMLVSITGSYGGCAIEFIIPTLLVVAARKRIANYGPVSGMLQSKLRMGILSSNFFVYLILGWSAVCLVLVTINHL